MMRVMDGCFSKTRDGLKPSLQGFILKRLASLMVASIVVASVLPSQSAAAENDPEAPSAVDDVALQRSVVSQSFRHDATLLDVCFIDSKSGWAVGDRGVILHTENGGDSWTAQASGVDCRLHSVCFINAWCGWAAGVACQPYSQNSSGVVLRTVDGGNTWSALTKSQLPGLSRIKFFDDKNGIALGTTAATQASGVFVSNDGGLNWQAAGSKHEGSWLAGDFINLEAGAVAGAGGQFAQFARGQLLNYSQSQNSSRSFRALRLFGANGGWLVGDGALVLTTNDLGRSWQPPGAQLPQVAIDSFDYYAVSTIGPNVWIAGAPGTFVLHSPDAGNSWETQSTGHHAPLLDIEFVDEHNGWAVGEFGNVIVTRDGGRSWQSQRSGGRRAAVLAIVADAADVPLELLAHRGAAEGYLVAVDVLHSRQQTARGTEVDDPYRNRSALLMAGAASANTAWRFPLPPRELAHSPEELLADLNRETDGRAIEQLERYLVRSIRMWRPEVVVTGSIDPETVEPHGALLASMIERAVRAAADPTRHVTLAESAGLPPWQAKQLYARLPADRPGDESVVVNEFVPQLATTLASFAMPARQMIGAASPATSTIPFKLVAHSEPSPGSQGRGILGGIDKATASDCRRPQPEMPADKLEQLRLVASRRQHIEALLQRTEGNAAWVAHLNDILSDLSPNDGAELLAQLAAGYFESGRLDLAADTHYLLTRRYHDHPLAMQSLKWMVQFYASSEMSHRLTSHRGTDVRQAQAVDIELNEPAESEATGVIQSVATVPRMDATGNALAREQRLQRATQLAGYIRTARPELYAEPRIRFAEVAAQRQLGLANPAKRYFIDLRQLPETNEWRRCGDTEMWLSTPAELPPPKTLGACRPIAERPHLDGVLSDACWKACDPLRLRTGHERPSKAAEATTATEVRFAYDREFLYIASRCDKHERASYEATTKPRPRDAELSQHDRITVHLDLDRDFTTAFELTFDSRGWTHDACWSDAHWNPAWYVAAGEDQECWRVEIAVPWSELIDAPPAARHVWAVAVRRTIPSVGVQSWAGGTTDADPEQFGFLLFE